MSTFGWACILISLALGALALWAFLGGRRQRQSLGLPAGRVVSADTSGWQACDQPLYSPRYRLAGRPDYLVQSRGGLIPVEAKPGRQVHSPYEADLLQLGAYLLLVEESTGRPPPYGILCYAERHFEVPYTPSLRQAVLASLSEMRRLRTARQAMPQHIEPQRCRRCGLRSHCDQPLG